MARRKCGKCGARVSTSAKVCPKCGKRIYPPLWGTLLVVIVITLFIFYVFYMLTFAQ